MDTVPGNEQKPLQMYTGIRGPAHLCMQRRLRKGTQGRVGCPQKHATPVTPRGHTVVARTLFHADGDYLRQDCGDDSIHGMVVWWYGGMVVWWWINDVVRCCVVMVRH